MNRLLEFWIGQSGRLSSTRLMATYTTTIVIGVWAYVSARKLEILPLPESLVVLVLGATGMVQATKFGKTKEPNEKTATA